MRDWKGIVRSRVSALHLAGVTEQDLVEELAGHVSDRYQELCSGGTPEPEAYQQALSELNDLAPLKGAIQKSKRHAGPEPVPAGGASGVNVIVDFAKDIRYAVRTIRKNPIFALFVMVTLGLGIGANTTVFTLVNTLLLNPLPVKNSSQLAAVAGAQTKTISKSKALLPLSYLDLKDYQRENRVFSSLAGYTSPRVVTLHSGNTSERMFSELVTAGYFSTLGLTPAIGRFFDPADDDDPGSHPVAVMNYQTWQGRFGGAADLIGRTLRVNNIELTVIGVAPPHFIGINAVFGPDLWIPCSMAEQLSPTEMHQALTDRAKAEFFGVGRLQPGISRVRAQANMQTIGDALAHSYPDSDAGRSATVKPIVDVLFNSASSGTSPVFLGSAVLLMVVGIVLLIACSNVANLMLARAAARRHEIGVRLAIGANRPRLVRQLLTESIFLALLSGAAGFFIGSTGIRVVWSSLPSAANFNTPRVDWSVLAFTFVVSLATGLAFGLVPALEGSKVELTETLKQESRTSGRSRSRISMANALLVAQVAFSFLLLVTAGLFVRSIQRAYEMNPGFQTEHLAVLLTNPGQAGYDQAKTKAFYRDVREQVAGLPGIASVGWASNLPLWGRIVSGVQIEGRQQRSRTDTVTSILNTVDAGYFETAGVALEKGRGFTDADRDDSKPVAVVNEKLARDYWPGQDALGRRLQLPGEAGPREVIGVARTANYSTLGEPPQPCVYIPLNQNYRDAMNLYVRSKGDPRPLLVPIQREVNRLGPGIMANDIRTGRTFIDNGLFQAKLGVSLLSVFGALALALASVGLYGLMAYSVHQRVREIGVRMALGAPRQSVVRLIVKEGMMLVLAGILVGFLGTLAVARLLSRMLYGVGASDPASLAVSTIILVGVALLACYLPARWASRVDPLVALRES